MSKKLNVFNSQINNKFKQKSIIILVILGMFN